MDIPFQIHQLLLVLVSLWGCHGDQTVAMTLMQHWDNNWEGKFTFPLKTDILGWEIRMHFDTPVSNIQVDLFEFISSPEPKAQR